MCIRRIAVAVFPIVFANTVSAVESEWYLHCPGVNNAQECAQRYEAKLLQRHPKLVERKQGSTQIRLDTGELKILNDPSGRFNAIVLNERNRSLVLREQYHEGNGWLLLNLRTSVLTEVAGYPVFSPSGRFAFAVEPLSDANYNGVTAAIFRMGEKRTHLVWRAPCRNTNWGPISPQWLSDNEVIFGQEVFNQTMERVQLTDARVRRIASGAWSSVGVVCRETR